jgi:Family of unknown function (DUF5995)
VTAGRRGFARLVGRGGAAPRRVQARARHQPLRSPAASSGSAVLPALGNQTTQQVLRSPVGRGRAVVQRREPASIPPPAGEVTKDAEGNRIEQRGGRWFLAERPTTTAFVLNDAADYRLIPINPNASFLALKQRCEQVKAEQLAHATRLKKADDLKWLFAKVYHYVTRFELANVDNGAYLYPHMAMQEVILFHATYEQNLQRWEQGKKDQVEANWKVAFQAAEDMNDGSWWRARSHEITYALLPSIQAHIRFDLPRAIAAAYDTHYRGIPGASLGAFRADFFAMGDVFERASEAIGPEIESEMWWLVDPGWWTTLREGGFPFFFHIGIERGQAWEKAEYISEYGGQGRDKLDRTMRGMIGAAHPYSGAEAFNVNQGAIAAGGSKDITGYDWLRQPGVRPDAPGPNPQQLPSPAPPVFPERLYFRFGRPRKEGDEDSGVRPDQKLDGLDALARWTQQVRGASVQVVGRASTEGSEEDNLKLGRNRAVALWFLLADRGADLTNNRLVLLSHGKTGAAATADWRRVEISIVERGQSKQQFTPANANLPSEVGR